MRRIIILTVFCISFTLVKAQSNVVAGGAEGKSSSGSVSFSIGQVDYTSVSGSGGTISSGMQQAFEIFVLGVDNKKISLQATVFPNPTVNYLTLSLSDYQFDKLRYMLFDMQGKLILQEQCSSSITKIDMTELSQGTYFLKVIDSDKELQSYKVIKN